MPSGRNDFQPPPPAPTGFHHGAPPPPYPPHPPLPPGPPPAALHRNQQHHPPPFHPQPSGGAPPFRHGPPPHGVPHPSAHMPRRTGPDVLPVPNEQASWTLPQNIQPKREDSVSPDFPDADAENKASGRVSKIDLATIPKAYHDLYRHIKLLVASQLSKYLTSSKHFNGDRQQFIHSCHKIVAKAFEVERQRGPKRHHSRKMQEGLLKYVNVYMSRYASRKDPERAAVKRKAEGKQSAHKKKKLDKSAGRAPQKMDEVDEGALDMDFDIHDGIKHNGVIDQIGSPQSSPPTPKEGDRDEGLDVPLDIDGDSPPHPDEMGPAGLQAKYPSPSPPQNDTLAPSGGAAKANIGSPFLFDEDDKAPHSGKDTLGDDLDDSPASVPPLETEIHEGGDEDGEAEADKEHEATGSVSPKKERKAEADGRVSPHPTAEAGDEDHRQDEAMMDDADKSGVEEQQVKAEEGEPLEEQRKEEEEEQGKEAEEEEGKGEEEEQEGEEEGAEEEQRNTEADADPEGCDDPKVATEPAEIDEAESEKKDGALNETQQTEATKIDGENDARDEMDVDV